MKRSRRKFTAKFKAKVALEAIKEQKSLSELAEQFELHQSTFHLPKPIRNGLSISPTSH